MDSDSDHDSIEPITEEVFPLLLQRLRRIYASHDYRVYMINIKGLRLAFLVCHGSLPDTGIPIVIRPLVESRSRKLMILENIDRDSYTILQKIFTTICLMLHMPGLPDHEYVGN